MLPLERDAAKRLDAARLLLIEHTYAPSRCPPSFRGSSSANSSSRWISSPSSEASSSAGEALSGLRLEEAMAGA